MMDTTDETVNPAVYRVSVRLPPFWPDRPAVWFAQAESQFELAAITRQRTKFNYVVSQLNHQQAAEVEDIVGALLRLSARILPQNDCLNPLGLFKQGSE